MAHGMAGNAKKAREILGKLERRARDSFVSPYLFGYVYPLPADSSNSLGITSDAPKSRLGAAHLTIE
jgi:hypothetical protein